MPKSVRHARIAKKNPPARPVAIEYIINDKNHVPDLRGHFAGQSVYRRGSKQLVRLTPAQAKFYLASGAITPTDSALKVSHASKPSKPLVSGIVSKGKMRTAVSRGVH